MQMTTRKLYSVRVAQMLSMLKYVRVIRTILEMV